MAKANITSKTGLHISIEGSDKEISNIINFLNTGESILEQKRSRVADQVEKKDLKKRIAASDLVIHLIEEGFFDKAKGLNEIAQALEEKAHLVPITTLSGVMIALVQKKFLRRKKSEGRWVYGK